MIISTAEPHCFGYWDFANKSSEWLWNPIQGLMVPTRWHRLVNYLSFDHYINAVLSMLWSNLCFLLTDKYDMILVSKILIVLSLLLLMWNFLIPICQLSASNSRWSCGNSWCLSGGKKGEIVLCLSLDTCIRAVHDIFNYTGLSKYCTCSRNSLQYYIFNAQNRKSWLNNHSCIVTLSVWTLCNICTFSCSACPTISQWDWLGLERIIWCI